MFASLFSLLGSLQEPFFGRDSSWPGLSRVDVFLFSMEKQKNPTPELWLPSFRRWICWAIWISSQCFYQIRCEDFSRASTYGKDSSLWKLGAFCDHPRAITVGLVEGFENLELNIQFPRLSLRFASPEAMFSSFLPVSDNIVISDIG